MSGAPLVLSAANLAILLAALVGERLVGYPDALYRAIRHPVVWMGAAVGGLDRALNRPSLAASGRRLLGVIGLAVLILLVLAVTVPLSLALRALPGGWIAEALIAASLLAQKELARAVGAVADGLETSLGAGREAVRHIVGRDPQALDGSGVACAAIESLAENAADGVVAPAFWFAVAGLPGIAVYKAINTADSMIGHRSPRHEAFGWAAARLDDLVNLPASRLTGLLFALAAPSRLRATLAAMRRDAPAHVSPNAGWPEAAMAASLGIRLGGPRTYGGRTVALATMGDGRAVLTAEDIRSALALYNRMLTLLAGLAALGLAVALAW
ncbi:cobalamin biosynthesis protein CobD [Kaustia mangrovi]|uniref:Cobalamin biosynthesis protein CobD n=1 Tax=Kaustia mangrovi TaxID=2593653 RepID=A0A7S8C6M0_9HYPH|nr:adenosylcobinamide-phosphate synthase CbiB [Kaustia mangrovi]QPC44373.1 cobalamin biosynthesis protein CobD [Kaustia mangrovi]